jgi:hypothetical protein
MERSSRAAVSRPELSFSRVLCRHLWSWKRKKIRRRRGGWGEKLGRGIKSASLTNRSHIL